MLRSGINFVSFNQLIRKLNIWIRFRSSRWILSSEISPCEFPFYIFFSLLPAKIFKLHHYNASRTAAIRFFHNAQSLSKLWGGEGRIWKKIKRIERTPGDCGISMEALKREEEEEVPWQRSTRVDRASRHADRWALNGGQIVNVDRKMEGGHFAGNQSSLIARDNRS